MFSVEWLVVRRLIEAIRRAFPRTLLVVGGEHVTACPDYTLTDCPAIDVGVLGEGEESIVDLAAAHADGRDLATVNGIVFRQGGSLVRTPHRTRIRTIDDIPEPDWTLFPVETYIDNALTHGANLGRSMPILASRGCPYECTFCSSPLMWTTFWTARRPELLVREMKKYMARYGVTNFDFYDLTAIVKKDWILQFGRLLLSEGLQITWQLPSGTRTEVIDAEVSRLLFESGCRIINYAPESGSPPELKRSRRRSIPIACWRRCGHRTRPVWRSKSTSFSGCPARRGVISRARSGSSRGWPGSASTTWAYFRSRRIRDRSCSPS
jgi:radical SAM superfamily enzyme YgiQ (UPF0313 family)